MNENVITILAFAIMGAITLSCVAGLLIFARMSFKHAAGEREATMNASRTALTYLQSHSPMDAVAAEALREREAAGLEVEKKAAVHELKNKVVPQATATGAYVRDPRTGEEFDIIAGAGV